MSAARKAFEVGADMWELDVRMSADEELIVFHDKTLSRTTNVACLDRFRHRRSLPLHQCVSVELQQLDAGSWFIKKDPFNQIREGRITRGEAGRYRGEPIPTLKQALAFSKENAFPVNVEIKDLSDIPDGRRIVPKLADLITDMDMTDQVLISSFNHEYLIDLKNKRPRIFTAVLIGTSVPDPVAILKRIGADGLHVGQKRATPELIEKVKEHGFFVNVYTVNDERSMAAFKRAGATGIITDFPQLCVPFPG